MVQWNVGIGHNKELMEKCPRLAEYAEYVGRVQKYAAETPLAEAVERAVEECIRDGILAEFLRKNRMEAIAVSIFEYDEEKELELLKEAERIYGREQGIEQGLARGLSALVITLKNFCSDEDVIYSQIIANPDYANLTREEFEKYL